MCVTSIKSKPDKDQNIKNVESVPKIIGKKISDALDSSSNPIVTR